MPTKIDELEDPNTWDWENAETLPGVASAEAVVSVRYSAGEFAAIAEHAERQGLTVTEFVRRAVLDAAQGHSPAS